MSLVPIDNAEHEIMLRIIRENPGYDWPEELAEGFLDRYDIDSVAYSNMRRFVSLSSDNSVRSHVTDNSNNSICRRKHTSPTMVPSKRAGGVSSKPAAGKCVPHRYTSHRSFLIWDLELVVVTSLLRQSQTRAPVRSGDRMPKC